MYVCSLIYKCTSKEIIYWRFLLINLPVRRIIIWRLRKFCTIYVVCIFISTEIYLILYKKKTKLTFTATLGRRWWGRCYRRGFAIIAKYRRTRNITIILKKYVAKRQLISIVDETIYNRASNKKKYFYQMFGLKWTYILRKLLPYKAGFLA